MHLGAGWFRSFAMSGLVAVCVGCGSYATFLATNTPPRPMTPRTPESVELITAGPPQRPFVEVGTIDARQRSVYSLDSSQDVLIKVRQSAAEVGCDAVLVTGSNNDLVATSSSVGANVKVLQGFHAACLMYKDAPAAPPAAAAPPPAAPAAAAPPPAAPPAATAQ